MPVVQSDLPVAGPPTRLVSYSKGGRPGFGLVSGDGVVELSERLPEFADVAAVVASGNLQEVIAPHRTATPDVALDEITFERVIDRPGKIFCIGVNYGGRSAEYTDATESGYPSVFVRFPDSLTGHDRALVRPPESVELDYEGEIVVVIGAGGRRIPVERAREHIAGVTLGNEGTIRDWVRHGKFNVTQGKNWDSSGSIGPWLVPIDEIPPFDELHLTTTVNGSVRQADSPATMRFPIEYQVHYLSTFTTLRPGDLVFTGTPTGAGARFDPPIWLEPGDVVEVTVPGIGCLRNTVVDEVLQ